MLILFFFFGPPRVCPEVYACRSNLFERPLLRTGLRLLPSIMGDRSPSLRTVSLLSLLINVPQPFATPPAIVPAYF